MYSSSTTEVSVKREVLGEMAETEIVDRYQLSGERINWLVEHFRGDLERDTARSCLLAAETQVNKRNHKNS